MAKPIFVVRFPDEFDQDEIRNILSQQLPDYHVITIPERRYTFAFECYNAKDAKDIDIEELRKELMKHGSHNPNH